MSWWHPAVRYNGKDVFGSTEAFNAAWTKKYGGKPTTWKRAQPPAAPSCKWRSRPPARSIREGARRHRGDRCRDFYGHVKFGADGQINSLQPPVFQLVGGKPVILWPAAIKEGELRFMSR